jgi:hypothetical protein
MVVNARSMTVALMMAVAYKILLKVGHVVVPSFFEVPAVRAVNTLLSAAVAVVIILFLVAFHNEEGAGGRLGTVLKVLIACLILRFILRMGAALDHQAVRLAGEALGVLVSILLFVVIAIYRRRIASGRSSLRGAATVVEVMLGIGAVKSLVSFGYLVRFVASGVITEFPQALYSVMLVLFLVTSGSLLYFLFRYYELKSAAAGRGA